MKEFLLGVYIGLGIVGVATVIFSIIAIIYVLASQNIFFTLVQEGRAKAIMRFHKFQRIVMAYRGFKLDKEWNVISLSALTMTPDYWQKFIFWFGLGGLRWVGIPFINSVHEYRFEWSSYEQVEESGKTVEKAITKQESIDFILVQDDIYFTFVKEAETKGMVPIDATLLLTLKVVNPYKALFRVQHWLEATLNRIKPAFRSFVAQKEFEQLIAQKEAIEEEVNSFLRQTKVDEFLRENYGVELVAIEIVRVDPAGELAIKFTEAAAKEWTTKKEAQQILVLADANAERMSKIYDKIISYGNNGLSIRMMETLEKASEKQGNWFIPFPIQNLINGILEKEVK